MQKKKVSDSLERATFPYNKINLENKNNKIGSESMMNEVSKINDVIVNKDINPYIMNALIARQQE